MLPVLVMIGAGGIEFINYILANQKLERIASISADNIARDRIPPSERSFLDTFAAIDEIAEPFDMAGEGRVILSGVIGVQQNGAVVGKIAWQRCGGRLAGVGSTVGTPHADPNRWAEGTDATLPGGFTLLQNQLVVISEVTYQYNPMISIAQLGGVAPGGRIRQTSTYVSRGQAFSRVTPVGGVIPATC